jgi:hypothetical protein
MSLSEISCNNLRFLSFKNAGLDLDSFLRIVDKNLLLENIKYEQLPR